MTFNKKWCTGATTFLFVLPFIAVYVIPVAMPASGDLFFHFTSTYFSDTTSFQASLFKFLLPASWLASIGFGVYSIRLIEHKEFSWLRLLNTVIIGVALLSLVVTILY